MKFSVYLNRHVFAMLLGVIGRLCSVVMAILGYTYYFSDDYFQTKIMTVLLYLFACCVILHAFCRLRIFLK